MDWTWIPPTAVALIAAAVAWRARHDVAKLHVEVNSRLTQLLETTEEGADAAGHARGVEDERQRKNGL